MAQSLYRPLTERLRSARCEFRRQAAGSHEIWYSPITMKHFSIPANISSPRLANEILKQAGLPKAY